MSTNPEAFWDCFIINNFVKKAFLFIILFSILGSVQAQENPFLGHWISNKPIRLFSILEDGTFKVSLIEDVLDTLVERGVWELDKLKKELSLQIRDRKMVMLYPVGDSLFLYFEMDSKPLITYSLNSKSRFKKGERIIKKLRNRFLNKKFQIQSPFFGSIEVQIGNDLKKVEVLKPSSEREYSEIWHLRNMSGLIYILQGHQLENGKIRWYAANQVISISRRQIELKWNNLSGSFSEGAPPEGHRYLVVF